MSRNYESSSSATVSSGGPSIAQSSLESEASDIRNQLKDLDDVDLPAKKDAGKVGRKIALNTNYFRVSVERNVVVTHFDFAITEVNATLGKESVKKRDEKVAFFQAFMKEKCAPIADAVAFDGQKNCYYMGEKEFVGDGEGKTFKFQYAPRGPRKRDFTVTIRKVNVILSNDINKFLSGHSSDLPQEVIQALDVVLRHSASTKFVQCGRNFFSPNQPNSADIGSGREVWFGYYQSLKAIEGKSGGSLALNIDTAATAFMREINGDLLVMEILRPRNRENDLANYRFYNEGNRRMLEKSIKGIQFRTTHLRNNDKSFRCSGLTRSGASNQRFKVEDDRGNSRETTVADYYAREYKIRLKYPDMPCLLVGNLKSGHAKFFPLELMKVAPRQRSPGKNDEMVTSNLIRQVAKPAPERERMTNQMAAEAIKNAMPMAQKYGMKINSRMEAQEGRVLPAPNMDYAQNKKATPRNGQWDTRPLKFYNAQNVEKWILVNFNTRCQEQAVEGFARELCKNASFKGMNMAPPAKIFNIRDQRELDTKLAQCAQNKMQLCVIIMARKDTQQYSFIKSLAEIQYGVMTQCVQSRNVDRCNGDLLGNLLQKINTKMGGLNTRISADVKLSIFKRPAMVVGISMTHPGANSSNPSIVSCTFTCDASVSKYVAHHRLQQSRFGIVADLKDLMVEGLKSFYRRTNKKPEKVVIYRNGGSEGELQKIAKYEVPAIKAAFAQLGKDNTYNPGLTVIVVNKMHHTRFFASNEKDRVGKSQNVPAGTCVDTNITSKSLCDWYITSSQGIQGTSRGTHYTLVHDDNDLSADSLQMMTWHLCHGYARCTRSVGIPVPVYYATLDCERVARYLNEHMGSDAGSIASGDGGHNDDFKGLAQNIKVKTEIPDMYFV